MIQAGVYRAQAQGCEFGVTSKGTEQAVVLFRLTTTGEQITWFGFLSDKAVDRTLEGLAACGWDPEMGIERADAAVRAHEVEIVVEHEEYEGKTRAKVAWVNAPGRVRVEALPPSRLQSLGDRLRARALTKGGKAQSRPAPSAAQPAPSYADDDMPF